MLTTCYHTAPTFSFYLLGSLHGTSHFWLKVQEVLIDNPQFGPVAHKLKQNVMARLCVRTIKRYISELRIHYIPFISTMQPPAVAFPVASHIAAIYVQTRFQETDAKGTASTAKRALQWIQRVLAHPSWPPEDCRAIDDNIDKLNKQFGSPTKRAKTWPIQFVHTICHHAALPGAKLSLKRLAALVAVLCGACKRKSDALPLCLYDFTSFVDCKVIFIPSTKTDQYREGSYSIIGKNFESKVCFCAVIDDYLAAAGLSKLPADHPAQAAPIFRALQYYQGGLRVTPNADYKTKPLSAAQMDHDLRQFQEDIGMTAFYTFHGCRALALSHGLRTQSVELMKRHGGWVSSAYLNYADSDVVHDPQDRLQPSILLSQAVSSAAPLVSLPNSMIPAPDDIDQDAVISAYNSAVRAANDWRVQHAAVCAPPASIPIAFASTAGAAALAPAESRPLLHVGSVTVSARPWGQPARAIRGTRAVPIQVLSEFTTI